MFLNVFKNTFTVISLIHTPPPKGLREHLSIIYAYLKTHHKTTKHLLEHSKNATYQSYVTTLSNI